MAQTVNFNDTTPAAPTNPQGANVKWQFDNSTPPNISAYAVAGSNGAPVEVALANLTAQAANISTTALYNVPSNGAGRYRVQAFLKTTQAATTSSTEVSVSIAWTDATDSSSLSQKIINPVAPATTATGVSACAGFTDAGTPPVGQGNATTNWWMSVPFILYAKASTAINYSTAGYVSSGATPMQYELILTTEYLG